MQYRKNNEEPPIKLKIDRLTPWTKAKIYRVLQYAYKGLNSINKNGQFIKEIEKYETLFLNETNTFQIKEDFLSSVVKKEDWVFTPLI